MSLPQGNVEEEPRQDSARPTRILVIDDDANFVLVVVKFLQQLGYSTSSALSGQEGLQLVRASRPDLVLCDLEMPGMDGHEVLRQLRQDAGLADIPFIFLTGQSRPEDIRAGMNLGADDYLAKPFNGEELRSAIQARLARLQALRERPGSSNLSPTAKTPDAATSLEHAFLVKTTADMKLIKVGELRSVVADGEYSWVHWDASKGALMRKSLKQWETELPASHFVRIHRRSIINLAHVERIEKTSSGQMRVFLRDIAEPLEVSLRLAPTLNRKLKAMAG